MYTIVGCYIADCFVTSPFLFKDVFTFYLKFSLKVLSVCFATAGQFLHILFIRVQALSGSVVLVVGFHTAQRMWVSFLVRRLMYFVVSLAP